MSLTSWIARVERVADHLGRVVRPLDHLDGLLDHPLDVLDGGALLSDREPHLTVVDYEYQAAALFVDDAVPHGRAAHVLEDRD